MRKLFSNGVLGEGINPLFLAIAIMMFIVITSIISQQISKFMK